MPTRSTHVTLALTLLILAGPALAGDLDGDGVPDDRDPAPLIAGPAPWARLELIELASDDTNEVAQPARLTPRATDERPDWPGARDATRDLFATPRADIAASGARELGWPSRPRAFADAVARAGDAARDATELRVALRLANPLPDPRRWDLRAIRLVAGDTPLATLPGGRWLVGPRSQLVVRLRAPLSPGARDRLLALTDWPTLALDGDNPAARGDRIDAATLPLRVAIPGRELCWRVARRTADAPITATQALTALAARQGDDRPIASWRGSALRAFAGRPNVVDQRWWRVSLGATHVSDSDWRARPLPDGGLQLRYLHRRRSEGISLDGRRYERQAEDGDVWAATVYGVCLHNGYGVPRDREAALRWWRAAAKSPAGAGAQVRLGRAYLLGRGVPRDLDQARAWFARAAKAGHADGQRYYARLLIRANQGPEAFRWYQRAARAGHAQAQMELGICYLQGAGVAKDEAAALRWFRAAAQEGLIRARSSWGWCLVNGRGAAEDRAFGLSLLRRSAEQGCDYARRVLRAQGELPR